MARETPFSPGNPAGTEKICALFFLLQDTTNIGRLIQMSSHALTIAAVAAVCCYYCVAWLILGRDPKPGTIVTRYEPPRALSPAMIRYVWKEAFDDRTFWAGILSLAAKGMATLENVDGMTLVRPTTAAKSAKALPKEEQFLLERILHRHGKKGVAINMLDSETVYQVSRMAAALQQEAIGKWFFENREIVTSGIVLSVIPVYLSANPGTLEQWSALVLALAVMAPGAFYLVFIVLRILDLVRATRGGLQRAIVRRAVMLCAMIAPCISAIILGGIVLSVTFGWWVLVVTAAMIALNVTFLHLMKAPTADGRKLLDEIEGFRSFLDSVERLPMDRADAPAIIPGIYERYLPYAVALEVEQSWSDRFVALAESFHEREFLEGAHAFYLGMWNDKPVEIAWKPEPRRTGQPW